MDEKVECLNCGWKGIEDQLVEDYYDSYNLSMPIATYCPECGHDTDDNDIDCFSEPEK